MPIDRLVLLADAHIGATPSESEGALIDFLTGEAGAADAVLIAGDLFNFWFAYAQVLPRRAFAVATAVAQTAARTPVYLLGGNHDRWGVPFWHTIPGVQYSPKEVRLEVAGRRVLALHGDGIAERGGRASAVHRLVRSRATTAIFRWLHPDLGIPLVERVAPYLGDGLGNDAANARSAERQRAWAERTLGSDPSVDVLIMAHSHVPVRRILPGNRLYLNPGAWFEGGQYATLDATGATLCTFNPAAPLPPHQAAPR